MNKSTIKEFTVLTPFSIVTKDATTVDKTGDNVVKIAGYANWSGSDENGKTYIDLTGDVVVPQGVDTSVWARNPQILWQHDRESTIGKGIVLEKRSDGIYIEAEIHAGAMSSQDWYRLTSGLVCMFSVGFRTLDGEWKTLDGEEAFFITKSLLLEVSVVSIPANSNSGFSLIKSLGDGFTSAREKVVNDDEEGKEHIHKKEDNLMKITVKRADLLSGTDLEKFKELGGDVESDVEVSIADFIKQSVAKEVAAILAAKEAEAIAAATEAEAKAVEEAAKAEAEAVAKAEAEAAEEAEKSEQEEKEIQEELFTLKELVETLKASFTAEEK